jgi:transposase
MEIRDARKLSPKAQESIRMRAVRAVLGGKSQVEVAAIFGVSRVAV